MTTMTHALTRNALDLLAARLDTAETPGDFLVEADIIVNDPANRLPMPISIEPDTELLVGREAGNARIVYDAVGALDRANAADGRLWTYLALVTFRDYMEHRWPLANVTNWKSRVETRWLMLRTSRQALVRHGIARLWWIGELTYDPGMNHGLSQRTKDPYAYTDWVLANEDRVQSIFEREAGSSPSVLIAAIDAMESVNTRARSALVKAFMKELRLASAYRDLDTLTTSDLASLTLELVSSVHTPDPESGDVGEHHA